MEQNASLSKHGARYGGTKLLPCSSNSNAGNNVYLALSH